LVNEGLTDNPEQPGYLLIASQLYDKTKRLPIAYQFAKRVTEAAPQVPEGWLNLGRINEELYRFEESYKCYKKALDHCKRKELRTLIFVNLSGLAVTQGKWLEAEKYARLALTLDPIHRKALGNLGVALLAQKRWREGWEDYNKIIGMDQRALLSFNGEGQWDGSKDKSIVIYGEQGLGDEICFASMFGEAIRDSSKVVIETNPKLTGLFQRSFPQAKVYGSRWEKKGLRWAEEDRKPDASISSGALGSFYRLKTEDFPGTPYLVADPERTAAWRALWKQKDKPAIGLAWTGGCQWTAAKFRKWSVKDLFPIIDELAPAHFVSLQYKDATNDIEGSPIVQYRAATLTDDYDDTASLVASLDLVICMQTAVAHLCGALGVPCIVFVPDTGQWRYGFPTEETTPWYRSVSVIHQRGDWVEAKKRGLAKARQILGNH
jgi:hypothetical protein